MDTRRLFADSRGQVSVVTALIFPLFILLLAFFVNMGLLIHQKIRIQNAVDAGVYSATASLARDLNEIAHLNRNIDELYHGNPDGWEFGWDASLTHKLNVNSYNAVMPIYEFIFIQYRNKYHDVLDKIESISANALAKADQLGEQAARLTFYNGKEELAELNPNGFDYKRLSEGGDLMSYQEFTNWETADYIKICEENPFDGCKGTGSHSEEVYLPIRKTSKVMYAARASADSGFVNIMPNQFRVDPKHYAGGSSEIHMKTYAAGQPYSGSVGGLRETYRANLIPLKDVPFTDDDGATVVTNNDFWH